LLGGAAPAGPIAARAQKRRTIGMLINGSPGDPLAQSSLSAFTEGLRALGWIDGGNLHIEYRWNSGNAERVRTVARTLCFMSNAPGARSTT
jgi:putative ABC transport system substrate-binding protein